ncbi:Naphthalene 1,2-dioxygenase system ferredoxin subunit [Aquisphaera giovannonii]|uniref:Naphthalene 1,2-dioxygenase system ferredoxin subunit n=1 Tax=Aquisphaera giovannonii TaxID=406548 RepID=A0A5B9W5U7_9BACT|nr:non-heme iron oxygenase ferredoxin subunit [Aquisphaera giovannonii]QEH36022.1 Naphthalene 1,2-dioxygenase system ferredoxin subunit [Aquisphaera giovannonii]
MPGPVKVAARADIPPGGKLLAEVDGRAIAVLRVGDDFYAIDDVCTHDGGPLAEGELRGCEIRCPRHGARFDVRDGRALSFPAVEPVPTHRVEIRGDDVLVHVDD